VVRVRRSSDNTEQDFTAQQITNGTLAAFVPSGNAFVRTWYNQVSGGVHLTQTLTDSQPRIVSNGVIESINGRPSLFWDGVDDRMARTAAPCQTVCLAANYTQGTTFSTFNGLIGGNSSNNITGIIGSAGSANLSFNVWPNFRINDVNNAAFLPALTSLKLVFAWAGSAQNFAWTVGWDRNFGNRFWEGYYSEIISYSNDQSSNRIDIQNSLNSYYKMF
jgi:hypothetical protein